MGTQPHRSAVPPRRGYCHTLRKNASQSRSRYRRLGGTAERCGVRSHAERGNEETCHLQPGYSPAYQSYPCSAQKIAGSLVLEANQGEAFEALEAVFHRQVQAQRRLRAGGSAAASSSCRRAASAGAGCWPCPDRRSKPRPASPGRRSDTDPADCPRDRGPGRCVCPGRTPWRSPRKLHAAEVHHLAPALDALEFRDQIDVAAAPELRRNGISRPGPRPSCSDVQLPAGGVGQLPGQADASVDPGGIAARFRRERSERSPCGAPKALGQSPH